MPRVVAIVQARMGSHRLPGKSMTDIAGVPMLGRVVERLRRASDIDDVWIATTAADQDAPIVLFGDEHGVPVVRGDEADVLARYIAAVDASKADIIVRATADCPLIDPEIANKTLRLLLDTGADFASNVLEDPYPNGMDTEVCTAAALRRAFDEAKATEEREHVMPYFYRNRDEFHVAALRAPRDFTRPEYRLCVDTAEDLDLMRAIYNRLGADGAFGLADIITLLDADPDLAHSNRHVPQKKLGE